MFSNKYFALFVIKNESNLWFVASLPLSVRLMFCVKDLQNYMTGVFILVSPYAL